MAVEPAEPAQAQEPLLRDDTEPEERRVEAGDVVALRGEEDVAVGVVEAELGDVQLVVEQMHDDVERAEARAEVPDPARLIAISASSRQRSASSASRASGSPSAPRTRSNSDFGTSSAAVTGETVAPDSLIGATPSEQANASAGP